MDPKDPNFINESGASATGYRLLTPETVTQLKATRRTLQIIVAGLLLGPFFYGVYVVLFEDGPWTFLEPGRIDFIMLGLGAVCLVASIFVPILVGKAASQQPPSTDPNLQQMLTGDPDHDEAICAAQRIQIMTIIGCALLEGGAFVNIFALSAKHEQLHLLVAVILLLGIVLRFPIQSRYLRRIEVAVETARLEKPLSK